MLTDSHCHLYAEQFDEDLLATIDRALADGINHFLLPNIDSTSIDRMHTLCDDYPAHCFPMMGLHPCSVNANFEKELAVAEAFLFEQKRDYIAVGEMGIDLYWDRTFLDQQKEAFRIQVQWAKELALPIVIHVRDSFDETLALMDALNDDRLSGVFHCFTGTLEQAQHILEYGNFMLGIGGVLTFKNGKIDRFIDQLDPTKIILETDSPYLAPKPHRGKRNEPAYIRLVAEKYAECTGQTLETVAAQTTKNCERMFGINLST